MKLFEILITLNKLLELGRSRKVPIRKDWESVKDSIMYQAVLKKFQTHDSLKEILLSTGDQDIIEDFIIFCFFYTNWILCIF